MTYGRDVVNIGGGGRILFVADFAGGFPDAAILVTSSGTGNGSRAHGVAESRDLAEFSRTSRAETLRLVEPAGVGAP